MQYARECNHWVFNKPIARQPSQPFCFWWSRWQNLLCPTVPKPTSPLQAHSHRQEKYNALYLNHTHFVLVFSVSWILNYTDLIWAYYLPRFEESERENLLWFICSSWLEQVFDRGRGIMHYIPEYLVAIFFSSFSILSFLHPTYYSSQTSQSYLHLLLWEPSYK